MDKKLYRSRRDRIIGGVCAGIAEYFNIDAILIRLAFVAIFFAEGAGLLAYVIAWIIIPEQSLSDSDKNNGNVDNKSEVNKTGKNIVQNEVEIKTDKVDNKNQNNQNKVMENHVDETSSSKSEIDSTEKNNSSQRILGLILLAVGGIFLMDIWIPRFYWRRFWPVLIIIIGISILFRGANNSK